MPEPRAPKPQRGDRYVAANIKYMKEFPTNYQKMALLPIIQTSSEDLPFVEFYEAWNRFRSATERSFGFLVDVADHYLVALAEEESLRRQSQSN